MPNVTSIKKRTLRKALFANVLKKGYHINEDIGCFFCHPLTVDEACIYHFQSEMYGEWKKWKHRPSPIPLKFKLVIFAGKMVACIISFFSWDSEIYSADLLYQLDEIKLSVRSRQQRSSFNQNNIAAHEFALLLFLRVDSNFSNIHHISQICHSQIIMFLKMKKRLNGRHFVNANDVNINDTRCEH